jgi:hypothetical protein
VPSREEIVAALLASLEVALGDERVQMSEEDGTLVVTGSRAAHERLAAVIEEMKRQQGVQVNLECRFVTLKREGLGTLSPEMRSNLALATRRPQAISPEEIKQLFELVHQDNGAQSLSAPNLTLFNQQKAYVGVTSDQFYVGDVELVEGGGWQPKVALAQQGVKVTVRAATSPDGTQVSAEVTWWLQRILDIETVEVAPSVSKQRAHLETRHGTRLVSGPAGTTFLVGVSEISPARGAPANAPSDLLLVLVKLSPVAEAEEPAKEQPQPPAGSGL